MELEYLFRADCTDYRPAFISNEWTSSADLGTKQTRSNQIASILLKAAGYSSANSPHHTKYQIAIALNRAINKAGDLNSLLFSVLLLSSVLRAINRVVMMT